MKVRRRQCIILSKTEESIGTIDIGLYEEISCLLPDLKTGVTSALFHESGKVPEVMHQLSIMDKGMLRDAQVFFRNIGLMSDGPVDRFAGRLFKIFWISSGVVEI